MQKIREIPEDQKERRARVYDLLQAKALDQNRHDIARRCQDNAERIRASMAPPADPKPRWRNLTRYECLTIAGAAVSVLAAGLALFDSLGRLG